MFKPDWTHRRGRSRLLPLAACIAAAAMLLPAFVRLTVREYYSDKLLLCLPIEAGEEFGLRFTHSLNLSDVTDTLEWTGEELILRSSLFTAFGAGMPVLADGIGSSMVNTPEGFLLSGIDTPQVGNQVPVMLQDVPDHRLLYRGEEIRLMEIAQEPFIKLSVERLPLWQAFMKDEGER